METIFKLIGAAGLALICVGILKKKRAQEDLFFILGGVLLEAYSIFLGDPIFIILQLVFIGSAAYDFKKRA